MISLVIEFVYLSVLLFSAVMAFIYRKCLDGKKILIMLPYLFLVFTQETTLFIIGELNPHFRNSIVYNIYQPLSVIVFALIYGRLPILASFKKLIAAAVIVYLFLIVLNFTKFESILSPSGYLPFVRSFLITSFGLLFLLGYFSLDNSAEEKFWRPLFWITVGIATFYPAISISLGLQKYLANEGNRFLGLKLYQVIPQLMSIFMYSCFSYAFYLCHRKT